MPTKRRLEGLGIVVTRPEHQAGPLCEALESEGARCLRFPALAITPPAEPERALAALARLPEIDLVVFVSPNAVTHGLALIGGAEGIPQRVWIAAVGRGTARAIEQQLGRGPDLFPSDRFDSEALLALPALKNAEGLRVLIVRGNGGRELLADALRRRGAAVTYAEVYRRMRPETDDTFLREALVRGDVQLITATSGELLENLVAMVGEQTRRYLMDTTLVVVTERMVQTAQRLGFRPRPVVAARASDDAIVAAAADWAAGRATERVDG